MTSILMNLYTWSYVSIKIWLIDISIAKIFAVFYFLTT